VKLSAAFQNKYNGKTYFISGEYRATNRFHNVTFFFPMFDLKAGFVLPKQLCTKDSTGWFDFCLPSGLLGRKLEFSQNAGDSSNTLRNGHHGIFSIHQLMPANCDVHPRDNDSPYLQNTRVAVYSWNMITNPSETAQKRVYIPQSYLAHV